MKNLIAVLLIILVLWSCNHKNKDVMKDYYLYVGAYTQGEEEGIDMYRFHSADGSLEYMSTTTGVKNPSYLAISEDNNLLLAVNEVVEFEGEKSGAISAFSITQETGELNFINQTSTGGGAPCYVSMDGESKIAMVANYVGGNVAAYSIGSDGSLSSYTDLVQHEKTMADTARATISHAHAIVPDPNENYALAVDLGIDQVISYKIDKTNVKLEKTQVFNSEQGAGPRHLVFHPNGKFVFIINELNSTITSCSYDASTGALSGLMNVPTLPADFEGENSCADIHFSDDGRFLYGSNRGHDSIVVFEIVQDSGALTYVSHHSVLGKTPRNFMIDPTGRFVLVANQNSNSIVVFSRDEQTGQLRETGIEVETPKPVCLKMMPLLPSRAN
jgi:6-phosphogluconolactonase